MKAIGKVKVVTDEVSGETKKGVWCRRGLAIEMLEGEKHLYFEFSGEDNSQKLAALEPGTLVEVRYEIESREFEGAWYTRLRGIGLTPYQQAS